VLAPVSILEELNMLIDAFEIYILSTVAVTAFLPAFHTHALELK
jgi:hypothetical protein